MNRREWNNILIWVTIALILVCLISPAAMSSEPWRMKVTFGMLQETQCAHYIFDTKESCEGAKAWFIEQAAWHGQNDYECVLDSQCPSD